MPDITPTNAPQELQPPDDFGAEIAALFQERQTRQFDPAAQRGVVEGNELAGITFGEDGASVDAFEQLAAQLNKEAIAERSPVVEPKILQQPEPVPTDPATPSPETTDTASQPVPGELPAPTPLPPPAPGESAEQQPPAVDGQQEPSDPGVPPPPGGYAWTLGDGTQTLQFTDEQVQMALALTDWANNLPVDTRQSIAAIETGQAVAINRAEFDQFVAWRNAQATADRDRDLSQYDDDAASEIKRLRNQVTQLQTPQQQQPQQFSTSPPPPPSPNNYVNANLNGSAPIYDAAIKQYQADNQLTQAELDTVLDVCIKKRFIAGIAADETVWNPITNQIVRPADPAVVIPQALSAALALNPVLHNSVISRKSSPSTPSPSPSPQPTAQSFEPLQPTIDPVAARKSRAASVASAPSAAVPPAPRNQVLTGDALVRAMAAELAPHFGAENDFAHVSAPTAL